MVDRGSGNIKVVRVQVLKGGSFTLSLIDNKDYDEKELIRIEYPNDIGPFEIKERIDHDLAYRLKCADNESFHVNVEYKIVPPETLIRDGLLGLLD